MEIKFKTNLLSAAIIFATANASTAYAQGSNESTDHNVNDAQMLEEVIVTGSRIKRANLETASPITSVSAKDIELSGNISLGDYLNELPALRSTFSNNNSGRFIGTTGLNLLDLRGMGTSRTLVLQDGRRHIGSSIGTSAVDVNTIPEDLLERVETVTGGQSAIYGADAVTGVVNFITRDDFEGLKVNLHHMQPERDGGEASEFSVTWGSNFADGRGNVAVSVQHSQTAEVFGKDRPWIASRPGYQSNPDDTGNDGIPDEILVFNTTNNLLSENGVIWGPHPVTTIFGLPAEAVPQFGGLVSGPYTFTNDGQLVAFNPGDHPAGETTSIGGDGLNFIRSTQLYPDLESQNYFTKAHFDLNDSTRLFAEAKYSVNKAESFGQPSFDFNGRLVLASDNAFLPAQLQQQLDDAGMDSFWYHRFHSDLGLRGDDTKREVQRYVLGVEGDLVSGWSYEVSAVYGQYDGEVDYKNNRHNARFFEAVDAVVDPDSGEIVCRSESARANGCQPINLFGFGLNSQEAIDYFMLQNTGSTEKMTQTVFTANVTGELFELPAGALATAIGVEYREETSEVDYDQVIKNGETFINALAPTSGEYDVAEAFFELSAPLLKDLPAIESLTLGASARFSDYDTIGNTSTWGASIDWAVNEDVRIRATSSEAVRAPNIDNLFAPLGENFFDWEDPCSLDKVDDAPDPNQRAARCAELGVPTNFNSIKDSSRISGLSGGNPELKEETAETITYGLVITPRFAPGLAISVDYWDMEISDAIDDIPAQEILERCVDSASINNIYCPLVPRGSDSEVISLTSPLLNIASLTARGIDYQVDYRFDLADIISTRSNWGSLKFSLLGTELLERNDFPFQDNPNDPDEERGELGDPIHSYTTNLTYSRGAFEVNWRSRYIDDMLLIEADERKDLQSPYKAPSVRYHDLQGSYSFAEFKIYGGINNIDDVEPPVGLSGTGGDSGIYSTLGRSFYLGVNYTLD